jgi:hypothetical protein
VEKYAEQLRPKVEYFKAVLGCYAEKNSFFLLTLRTRNLNKSKYNTKALSIADEAKKGLWVTASSDDKTKTYALGYALNQEKFAAAHPIDWKRPYTMDEYFEEAMQGRLILWEHEFGPEMDRLLGRG